MGGQESKEKNSEKYTIKQDNRYGGSVLYYKYTQTVVQTMHLD